MASQQCPTCGSIVPASARTCPVCGAPLDPGAGAPANPDLVGVLPAGTQLNNGAFSVGRMLGRGGFGITYLGGDLRLKRTVAIKEFFPAGSVRRGMSVMFSTALSREDYDLTIRKFMEEAQMLARFRHRSIVSVYEVFRENDTAYMVMEYLKGENLLERMERRGAPLGEQELIHITEPVTEALDEVHASGVLHRDIKPENIMLVGPEDRPRPVLIDFGAAREFASGMANRHSIVLTPGYAPLEQYGEQARRGPFTDVYALAATIYHVATGMQPPAATERALGVELKAPRTLNPALSAQFDVAIMHGLRMKVDERPQSATLFYRELATGEASRPAETPAYADSQPHPREVRPSPAPPAPPGHGSHLGRVREIARQIGQMGVIQEGRVHCPVCRSADMFDTEKGITSITCPVCRSDRLEERFSASDPLLCPSCRQADLQALDLTVAQGNVLMRCPACRVGGVVAYASSQMLFIPDLRAQCDTCHADFDYHSANDSLRLDDLPTPGYLSMDWVGETRTRREWADMAGSRVDAYVCPVCDSAFETCGEGSLEWVAREGSPRAVPKEHRGQCRSMAQWQRIATGGANASGSGNGSVVCPTCDAQFDEPSPGRLTLLDAFRDPYGTVAAHRGRTYPAATWLMLSAGEQGSLGPGLACPVCTAYLEKVGRNDAYELAWYDTSRDPFGTGQRHGARTMPLHDWQRIGAGGVPKGEYDRLREEATRELWAAMLAGEMSTSAAENSYPLTRQGNEKVVMTFGALRIRTRFGFMYEQDSGQIWLTTRQLFYRGNRGTVEVALREAGRITILDTGYGVDPLVEIRRKDGKEALSFTMASAPLELTVDGLALQLPWDVDAFAELFENLRLKT